MTSEKKYWEDFYKVQRNNTVPSAFAKYVMREYLKSDKMLLELGCGNGRDSLFFASKGINTTAIDFAQDEISYLNSLRAKSVDFICGDFTNLEKYSGYDYIYSRFTFHSIRKSSEDVVLSKLTGALKPGGLFLLEARSEKDKGLNKFFGVNHFRRYLNFEATVKKIENLGFEIIESIESQGLAVYEDEDPFVLRVVALNRG